MAVSEEYASALREIDNLRSLLIAYICHVGCMEGIAFIEGCDHCHEQVTDEQWEELKKFDQLAKDKIAN